MTYGYPEKWMEGLTTGESIAAEIRLGIVSGEEKCMIYVSCLNLSHFQD